MTTDRLAEIEDHYQHCWVTEVPHAFDPGSGHLDDVEWLISDVKRLRELADSLHDAAGTKASIINDKNIEIERLRRAADWLQAYADSHPCDHMPRCRT